ncbi:MAG: FAD-dependent oxidoreductase [Lentisphaeria bacterium]|nr:FAD-dependent oxidoreductase [Lentisphaeria bacterium]
MKIKQYDVVVCGAGIAGVAAAVSAARQGAKTALIEKQCLLGGLATSGLIYIYLPLCDGYGNQMIHGISEEMLKRCVDYGPFDVPEQWGGPKGGNPGCIEAKNGRYACCFSPAGFSLVLDKMLAEAGVDLWLDTVMIEVEKNGNAVSAITVFNASGKVKIAGKCFVDATGGAHAVQLAGGKIHRTENRITPWVMEMAEDSSFFHFTGELHIQGALKSFVSDSLESSTGAPICADCSSGKAVTDFVRCAWQLMRGRYDAATKPQTKRKTYPVHLPAMPQLRKIGCIDALKILKYEDRDQRFEDSIGLVGDWRKPAPVWDTPYRTLVPRDVENILAAGRCIGTLEEAWEVYRVIPVAAMTGEAAGVAATLCAEQNVIPSKLDIKNLQKTLSVIRKNKQ